MYARMSDILHERIIGEYSIEKFSIKERDLCAMIHGISPGKYVRLCHKREVVMSDTDMEKRTNAKFVVNADVWEYTPSCKFNTIYLDIWNYINTDVYRDSMKPLISRYRKFLVTKEVDNKRFIDCWCRLEAKNGVRI